MFTSLRLNLAWATEVAAVYTVMCLAVGHGLDFEAMEDKTLFARVLIMYTVAILVNRISSRDRIRRREAVERNWALQQERLEVSQTIHDTAAQSAYMIGLGIDTARALSGDSNQTLSASLAATSALSKQVIWELRRPIGAGRVFEGIDLGDALRQHTETFRRIT